MESRDYEKIGRIYCAIVELQKVAWANDLYIGGGLDKEGDFYLSVYDKLVDKRFYSSPIYAVIEANYDAINAEVNTVKGFVAGWIKAREIAALAAQPEVEFDPDAEAAKKEPIAVEA